MEPFLTYGIVQPNVRVDGRRTGGAAISCATFFSQPLLC